MKHYAAFTLVGLLAASPVWAKTVSVTVDARSGPWSVKANPKMPYGIGDANEPTIVRGIEPDSGRIEIYTEDKVIVGGRTFDSIGDAGKQVDDGAGRKNKRFPSFYTPKVLYPAFAHGLVATFVDDVGKVIGRPFMVGNGARVQIPELATGLAFGVNDDSFADNAGSFTVKLVLPDD